MDLYFFIAFIVLLFYVALILGLTVLWVRNPEVKLDEDYNCQTTVSIIISARNEECNISKCLNDLLNQNYQSRLFEIIVVDDSSEDKTAEILDEFEVNYQDRIRIITLNEVNPILIGKKAAISKAVKIAKGSLIVTTDADCRFGTNWLKSIVSFYEKNTYKIIVGPVAFINNGSLFDKLQLIEFMGLIGITGSFCFAKHPIICNGANFIYEKSLFEKLNSFANDNIASGDDVFLLLDAKAKEPFGTIGFLKSREAIVYTLASKSITDFFMQRKRWASKASSYSDFDAFYTSLLVFICNASIITTLILSIFSTKFVLPGILMLIIKSAIDFAFLYSVSGFFNLRKYFWLFLPEQLLYIFYVLIIGVSSQFGKYRWKNRQVV